MPVRIEGLLSAVGVLDLRRATVTALRCTAADHTECSARSPDCELACDGVQVKQSRVSAMANCSVHDMAWAASDASIAALQRTCTPTGAVGVTVRRTSVQLLYPSATVGRDGTAPSADVQLDSKHLTPVLGPSSVEKEACLAGQGAPVAAPPQWLCHFALALELNAWACSRPSMAAAGSFSRSLDAPREAPDAADARTRRGSVNSAGVMAAVQIALAVLSDTSSWDVEAYLAWQCVVRHSRVALRTAIVALNALWRMPCNSSTPLRLQQLAALKSRVLPALLALPRATPPLPSSPLFHSERAAHSAHCTAVLQSPVQTRARRDVRPWRRSCISTLCTSATIWSRGTATGPRCRPSSATRSSRHQRCALNATSAPSVPDLGEVSPLVRAARTLLLTGPDEA